MSWPWTAPPTTKWWLPQPWSVPLLLQVRVRPKSEAVKVVTWLPRPGRGHQAIEVLERLAELGKQVGVGCGLVVVGIEAAELHIEDLAGDAEAGAAADDAGDGLQRSGERVVGELVGGGVEILRRVGNAARAGGQHGRCEQRLRLRWSD